MKIVSLKKLVEENDIKEIVVAMGEGVKPVTFTTDSPDYREQKNWFVKGDYRFGLNPKNENCLFVERLEEELNVSINKPAIMADDVPPEEVAKLEEHLNTTVTAFVFHRGTLRSAGKEVMRKHVVNFAHAVMESFKKNFGEAKAEDFAVLQIDWNNRSLVLTSLEQKEEEKE